MGESPPEEGIGGVNQASVLTKNKKNNFGR